MCCGAAFQAVSVNRAGRLLKKPLMSYMAAVLVTLLTCGSGRAEDLSYSATVKSMKELLPLVSSDLRRETYGNLDYCMCVMGYSVSGFYPNGTPYSKTVSGIDFASLNDQQSKTGSDKSGYVILSFDKPFMLVDGTESRASRVLVIDAASDWQAQRLFRTFLDLGKLCRGFENGSQG